MSDIIKTCMASNVEPIPSIRCTGHTSNIALAVGHFRRMPAAAAIREKEVLFAQNTDGRTS